MTILKILIEIDRQIATIKLELTKLCYYGGVISKQIRVCSKISCTSRAIDVIDKFKISEQVNKNCQLTALNTRDNIPSLRTNFHLFSFCSGPCTPSGLMLCRPETIPK